MKLKSTSKAQSPKKKEKKKEIIIIIKKKRKGSKLGQARGHATKISVMPEDMQHEEHQGPRTLMCL